MNYEEEFNNLKEPSQFDDHDWFDPKSGKYAIKFLSEGTPFSFEYKGETIHKTRYDIEANGERFVWGVPKGMTTASLHGQLMLVATQIAPKNKLEGKTISLIVKSDGKKRDYSVMEALSLMAD